MNASFRRAVLGIVFVVLCITTIGTVGAILHQAHGDARATAERRVTEGARLLGELYATRRTQVALDGRQLVAGRLLADALAGGDRQIIEDHLARRTTFGSGAFAVVIDSAGENVAAVGEPGAASAVGDVIDASSLPRRSDLRLVDLGGALYLLALTPLGRDGAVVVNGLDLRPHLAARVMHVSALQVGLRSANEAFGNGFAAAAETPVRSTSISLDQLHGRELVADIAISASEAFAVFRGHMWKAITIGVTVIGLGALILALLLGRLVRVRIQRPLDALRQGFRRAMDGDYSQSVIAPADTPFAPMIRAFNDMQTRVAEREGRIVHHAQYDALTGLTNRTVVDERIHMALAKAQRTGAEVAAIALDLTRFNEVNGSLGQDVGDEVLKEVARRLASNTRVTDTVARVGGDEFFVLLEETDVKLASHMAEFLVAAIEAPIRIQDHEVRLHLHAGLALYPTHCEAMEALRRMANIALLTAKEQQERVVVYEPGQDERQLRELAIVHDLPSAIRNGELYLQYQPKIDVETQRVEYVEALVRWRHPQLGFIPPDEFVALLEKSGTVANLTEWVFKAAAKQSAEWSAAGYDFGIAVNISANDLSDEGLPERVKTLLRHHAVDAGKISVEVTESAVISDPERSVSILKAFRKSGFKIALDDFGTGQTSLALLKQLPLSEIKIDKSFVQSLRANSGDAIIVKSIIDLGHNMGLVVTAEGVESNYCWNLLNSYGCDLVQGYLVSAPLTSDELTAWYLKLQKRHVNTIDFSCAQNVVG